MSMSSESEAGLQMLVAVSLDLQIKICTFLHPSDILALRKTCTVLQHATKQRIIWIDALRRVCLDNTLFLPSFPIPDMSDVELEQAAMAPHRWIHRCATFAKQHYKDFEVGLRPITTRIIRNPLVSPGLFSYNRIQVLLVPGGRYLVSYSPDGICVWDLGYTSNADCRLLASVGPEAGTYSCMVNPTSDGMGLIIFPFPRHNCYVYEIYPQSETPQLTQIAKCAAPPWDPPAYLMGSKVIWYSLRRHRIVFTVWDYRLNHSISFSGNVDNDRSHSRLSVIATTIAIIVLCEEEILVWGIPPLSPQPPDFSDQNPTHIPSLFRITFPGDLVRESKLNSWKPISSWYSGPSYPLYFGVLCQDLKIHDFKIIVKPDLSDVSLHVMNTSQFTRDDFNHLIFQPYSICENTLVSWGGINRCRIHIRSMSSPDAISPGSPIVLNALLSGTIPGPSSCPASGRFVYHDKEDYNTFVVVDFLPYL